jgi:hypothetical protein
MAESHTIALLGELSKQCSIDRSVNPPFGWNKARRGVLFFTESLNRHCF